MNRGDFLRGTANVVGAAATLPPSPFTPTLRLAVVCPQSGIDRVIGQQLVTGVRAAVDYENNLRAPTDPALLYTAYDDHNIPSDAVVQSSFAVGNPDTLATIGHLSSAATLVALQGYGSAQMPLIVPTVTDDQITAKGYRNIFRLPTKDSDEGGLVAQYAISTGSKAPHVVTQDGDYGPAVAGGFTRRASAMHMSAASTTCSLDKPDFAKAAADVLAHQPDCVALAGNAEDLGPLMAILRAGGYTGRFLGTQGFFDALTVQRFAKEAEGMVVSSNVPYYPLAPTVARDVADYQAHYGALTPVAAFGYAAVQLIQLAQRRSGATTRAGMIRALATGGSYDTVTGSYTFGATGDVFDPNCYFYKVSGGKFAYERQAHRSGFMLK
ncbi:MAG: Extracellular ligand-binding receptor [Candidatus Eremiobacteraeota bacterium]|nr:Extracellular ligand-binding receptor [Candidatus Eremiobacteraeota bacterium]